MIPSCMCYGGVGNYMQFFGNLKLHVKLVYYQITENLTLLGCGLLFIVTVSTDKLV